MHFLGGAELDRAGLRRGSSIMIVFRDVPIMTIIIDKPCVLIKKAKTNSTSLNLGRARPDCVASRLLVHDPWQETALKWQPFRQARVASARVKRQGRARELRGSSASASRSFSLFAFRALGMNSGVPAGWNAG